MGLNLTKLRLKQQNDIGTIEPEAAGASKKRKQEVVAVDEDSENKTSKLMVAFYDTDAKYPVFMKIEKTSVQRDRYQYDSIVTDYRNGMSDAELEEITRERIAERVTELDETGCSWTSEVKVNINFGMPFVAAFYLPWKTKTNEIWLAGVVSIVAYYTVEQYAQLMKNIFKELLESNPQWRFYCKEGTFGQWCPNLREAMTDWDQMTDQSLSEDEKAAKRKLRYYESEMLRYSFLSLHEKRFAPHVPTAELVYVCTSNGGKGPDDITRIPGVLRKMTETIEMYLFQSYVVPTALQAYREGWSADQMLVEDPYKWDRYKFLFDWILRFTFLELHSVPRAVEYYKRVGYSVLKKGGQREVTYMYKSGQNFLTSSNDTGGAYLPMGVPRTLVWYDGSRWTGPPQWDDRVVEPRGPTVR